MLNSELTNAYVPTRGDKQTCFFKQGDQGSLGCCDDPLSCNLGEETYTRTWYYGKTRTMEDGKTRKPKSKCGFGTKVGRPRDEKIAVTAPVPVIIYDETFQRAVQQE